MSWVYVSTFDELKNKKFSSVTSNSDGLYLKNDTESYAIMHKQDCCEHVELIDIVGDIKDLENSQIYIAECVTNDASGERDPNGYKTESATWSFIKLATFKGYVDLRFFGQSNGYYSETAELYKWE